MYLGTPPSQDPLNREWTTAETLACLDALRIHFHGQPKQYKRLLSLITDWWSGRVQSTEMVSQCARLLQNRPRLLRDINCLLKGSPQEVKIICSVNQPDVNCVVAVYSGSGIEKAERIGMIHPISPSEPLPHPYSSKQLGDGTWDHIHSIEARWAPFVMELLQIKLEDTRNALLRNNLLKSLRLLNRLHGVLPPSIFAHDVSREGENPVTGGGFADIWKGKRNGQLVCLKVLRFFSASSDQKKIFKDLSNEVLVWKQLQHQNILPLYGVNVELFQPRYCIVSPWMQNGDIGSYLSGSKQSTFEQKLAFMSEIAEGLAYLHELDPPVIHGDIKGANVLISDDLHCCLADFGLSVIETQTQSFNPTGSASIRGSMRWLAPELINPPGFSEMETGRSRTRDIYAFACTVIEILTGKAPFIDCKNDAQVMIKVLNGGRPNRPSECTDELWALLQHSWSEDIAGRPTARYLVDSLRVLLSPANPFVSLNHIQVKLPPKSQLNSVVHSADHNSSSSSILGSNQDLAPYSTGHSGTQHRSSTDTAVPSSSNTLYGPGGSSNSSLLGSQKDARACPLQKQAELDKMNIPESEKVEIFSVHKQPTSDQSAPPPPPPKRALQKRALPSNGPHDISIPNHVQRISSHLRWLPALLRSTLDKHHSAIPDSGTSTFPLTQSQPATWHERDFDPYSEYTQSSQNQGMVGSSPSGSRPSFRRESTAKSVSMSIAPGVHFNSDFLPPPMALSTLNSLDQPFVPLSTLSTLQTGLFRSNDAERMIAMQKLTGGTETYDPWQSMSLASPVARSRAERLCLELQYDSDAPRPADLLHQFEDERPSMYNDDDKETDWRSVVIHPRLGRSSYAMLDVLASRRTGSPTTLVEEEDTAHRSLTPPHIQNRGTFPISPFNTLLKEKAQHDEGKDVFASGNLETLQHEFRPLRGSASEMSIPIHGEYEEEEEDEDWDCQAEFSPEEVSSSLSSSSRDDARPCPVPLAEFCDSEFSSSPSSESLDSDSDHISAPASSFDDHTSNRSSDDGPDLLQQTSSAGTASSLRKGPLADVPTAVSANVDDLGSYQDLFYRSAVSRSDSNSSTGATNSSVHRGSSSLSSFSCRELELGVPATFHQSATSQPAPAIDPISTDLKGGGAPQHLMIKEEGKRLTHLQLGSFVGHGRFGSVYRALNIENDQTVVVKRVRLDGFKEEEVMQLMREVDLVKRLSHPSIVNCEGMHRDSDTLNIVSEYVEDDSLACMVKASGKLREGLVVTYVMKILEGLHYLHQNNIIHGDLKASNIFTTTSGNVKLSDFGICLNMKAMERTIKDVTNVPNWMAPEVIKLEGASTKSDIWSLGCTAIELLTGQPPHGNIPDNMSVMFHIVEDDMPPIPSGCSPLLKDFLKNCFNKNPMLRPSAEVLLGHPWLQDAHKDLRPQEGMPRCVSADLRKSGRVRYMDGLQRQTETLPTPAQRSSDDEVATVTHSFINTIINKPTVCQVCLGNVKKYAVHCTECNLVCHAKCAADSPPRCDLWARLSQIISHSSSTRMAFSSGQDNVYNNSREENDDMVEYHSVTPVNAFRSTNVNPPLSDSLAGGSTDLVYHAWAPAEEEKQRLYDRARGASKTSVSYELGAGKRYRISTWNDPVLLAAWEDYRSRQAQNFTQRPSASAS